MEEELKCPVCRQFLKEPILLQCGHAYCRLCGIKSQHKISTNINLLNNSDTISVCISDDQDSDKLSVVSETDSGVVCTNISGSSGSSLGLLPISSTNNNNNNNNNSKVSRPSSFTGSIYGQQSTSKIPNILTPSTSGYVLICDVCHKQSIYLDENSIKNLPENLAIKRILSKFRFSPQPATSTSSIPNIIEDKTNSPPNCQWCEGTPKPADLCCEICNYYYCTQCQTILHPSRGPLKEHLLIPATSKRLKENNNIDLKKEDTKCTKHFDEVLTMYCTICKIPVCCLCVQELRHSSHEMQSLDKTVKIQKNELSKILKQLTEKVQQGAEDVNKLKQINDKITINCDDFKSNINIQIDALIEMLQERRQALLQFADVERDTKKKLIKEQSNRCTSHLNKTSALINFGIQVLKEPDPIVYLQIGQHLCSRASNHDFGWYKEMKTKPEIDPEFVLSLDSKPLQLAIQSLDFIQLKAPAKPFFDTTECIAENNSVTVVWHSPDNGSTVDGYILEIDSGKDDGHFKEVYTGPDNICTIDGLHFDTIYNVRVKAFNSAGESLYSDPIGLQTAHVAWFQLTKSSSQRDAILSNERATLTGTTLDYRVILGSVSFSKGVHYWEITIDNFEGNGDIVVGVAQSSVNRNIMLGKDIHGWAMYIDDKRSWYLHNDNHHGRISVFSSIGTVIGILMDCDQGVLSFYVNDKLMEIDGMKYAFKNMPRGLYYPAFSVNKTSKITVHTGLLPPHLRRSSNSDDSVNDTL